MLLICCCVAFEKVTVAREAPISGSSEAASRAGTIHEPFSVETSRSESPGPLKWLPPALPEPSVDFSTAPEHPPAENVATNVPAEPAASSKAFESVGLAALNEAAVSATTQQQIPACSRLIHADVVAIDRVIFYNRFGAFNPAGMMYALSRDVEKNSNGDYQLKEGKRPRPIVLRANVGDCLQVNFTNRLHDPRIDNNSTATRNASVHVNGLDYVGSIASDGANVGKNPSSLVKPGDSKTYTWYAKKQGQYMLNSMGAAAGGEGDGGQVVLGLFGSVNVEPRGSRWYRSQVTSEVLDAAIVPPRTTN